MWFFNYTFGMIAFRCIPKSYLFSRTVYLELYSQYQWRQDRAEWWQRQLNMVDIDHIHKGPVIR